MAVIPCCPWKPTVSTTRVSPSQCAIESPLVDGSKTSSLMCADRLVYRYRGADEFSGTIMIALVPWRISSGRPGSMTNGTPSRLHQRTAYASFLARASILARVTVGNRLALGTLRLSNESSQKPEMSGVADGSWG